MNEIYNSLGDLVSKIQESRESFSADYNKAFEVLKSITESCPRISQIIDFERYSIVYQNKYTANYFNISNEEISKLGFAYVFRYLHPENFGVINTQISFFSNPKNYNQILAHVYHVNTKDGWRWMYNCSKVATYTQDGRAKYILTQGCDIHDLLKGKNQFRGLKKNLSFIEQNLSLFELLTPREKQILKLISEENTTQEIAKQLGIGSSTVDTHRNNIIHKLQVKSSVGLVKYALMFDLI